VWVGRSARFALAGLFRDPDGDALTYAASSSNVAVALATVEGSDLAVAGLSEGTASITVTATDPGGLSVSQAAPVTVQSESNTPPVTAAALVLPALGVGQVVRVSLSGLFRDPDGDALTYAASSSNVAVALATVEGSDLAVLGLSKGTASVTVTATERGGLSVSQTAPVTVKAERQNQGPVITGDIGDRSIKLGFDLTVFLSDYFEDPDADTLGYAATSSNTDVVTVELSGHIAKISSVAIGTAALTFTARDPAGLSVSQTVTITIVSASSNHSPTITRRIEDVRIRMTDEGPPASHGIILGKYFDDPDRDRLEFALSTPDTEVISVDQQEGGLFSIVAKAVGFADVTASATDPDGESASQQFQVEVAPSNTPPQTVGSLGNLTMVVDSTVIISDVSNYFTDPDQEALVHLLSSSDITVARIAFTGRGSEVSVDAIAPGVATMTIVARDPAGATAEQTFHVTVVANDQNLPKIPSDARGFTRPRPLRHDRGPIAPVPKRVIGSSRGYFTLLTSKSMDVTI
jgi:hypothetical protein